MTKYAVAILLALTMPASAEDTNSANSFLPGCKSFLNQQMRTPTPPPLEAFQQGSCAGFVAGLLYGVEKICRPKEVTFGQSVAVVVKYIQERPERMHEDFGRLALEALTAAWPCKR